LSCVECVTVGFVLGDDIFIIIVVFVMPMFAPIDGVTVDV